MSFTLIEALGVTAGSRIAFVGAGGKTTAMFTLARQVPGPVICAITTHLGLDQAKQADRHVIIRNEKDIRNLFNGVLEGVILLTGVDSENRLVGLTPEQGGLVETCASAQGLPVLVEADGSRRLPLKAPAAHEPPIPGWVTQVVYMFGLSAVGKALTAENIFREEIFAQLSGADIGEVVTIQHIVRFLLHPSGGLKNIPLQAQRIVFANQLDEFDGSKEELFAALSTLSSGYDTILAGSLTNAFEQVAWRYKKVAGIVLAAGGSTRMGTPKQLLPWQGKPLVRHAAEKALAAGLDPVIVVTGFAAAEVEQALAHLPVIIARNPGWELGQSASIQCGLRKIPPACGAAIFLLTDMPQVPLNILRTELEIYQTEPAAILCPSFDGQRGNPVLFARQAFPELMNLTGDTGGRALFDRFPIRWLEWDDPAILQDIDTLEDYRDFMQGDAHDR